MVAVTRPSSPTSFRLSLHGAPHTAASESFRRGEHGIDHPAATKGRAASCTMTNSEESETACNPAQTES